MLPLPYRNKATLRPSRWQQRIGLNGQPRRFLCAGERVLAEVVLIEIVYPRLQPAG